MKLSTVLGVVAVSTVSLASAGVASIPGWYAGSVGQSCTEACMYQTSFPCNVAGLRKLNSREAIEAVGLELGGSATCVDTFPTPYALNPLNVEGECYFASNPDVGPRSCEGGGVDVQRFCCCADDPADCPAKPAACVSKGRSKEECELEYEGNGCVYLDWSAQKSSMIAAIRSIRVKLRTKRRQLKRNQKRRLRRKASIIQREISSCTGHGGCASENGPCFPYCKTLCDLAAQCKWVGADGRGCEWDGSSAPTPGPTIGGGR